MIQLTYPRLASAAWCSSAEKSDLLLWFLAQRRGAIWTCIDPALRRSASLIVPLQAHEGMTLRFIGPLGLS
jgi:hypothetical protein